MPARIDRLLVMTGTFSVPISQWLVFLIVARMRGSESAGSYALLIAIAAPTFIFIGFGLRNRLVTDTTNGPIAPYFHLRWWMALFGSALFFLFTISLQFPAVLSISVAVQKCADAMADITYGVLQREGRLRSFGSLMLLNGVLTSLLAWMLSQTEATWGPVTGSAIGSVLAGGVAIWSTRRIWRIGNETAVLSRLAYRSLLRSSRPIAVGSVVAVVTANLPVWVVGLRGTRTDVATMAILAYVVTAATLLGTALGSVAVAEFASLMRSGCVDEIRSKALRQNSTLTAMLTLVAVPSVYVGDKIIAAVYGSEFQSGYLVLVLFAIAVIVTPGSYIISAAYLAQNRYRHQMYVTLASLAAAAAAILVATYLGSAGVLLGAVGVVAGAVVRAAVYWFWA